MISAGKKLAKATAIRFIKSSQKGTLGLQVAFTFQENGQTERLHWTGWITPNALEGTLRTLVGSLDYNGDERTVQVPPGDPNEGMLQDQDCINRKKEVELVVEMEPYTKKDGTQGQGPRIKWVNNVGGGQFAGVAPQVVKNELDAMGFKAAFLAAKQGKGSTAPAPQMGTQQPMFTEEDIPF